MQTTATPSCIGLRRATSLKPDPYQSLLAIRSGDPVANISGSPLPFHAQLVIGCGC
jgi:hypothetical protein